MQEGGTVSAKAQEPEPAWLVPRTKGRVMWLRQSDQGEGRGPKHRALPGPGLTLDFIGRPEKGTERFKQGSSTTWCFCFCN